MKGNLMPSDYEDHMVKKLLNNQIPYNWTNDGYGFLSMKPLNSWIKELKDRVAFLDDWNNHGIPKSFWANGFFFPQAFLTGIKQNYSRK